MKLYVSKICCTCEQYILYLFDFNGRHLAKLGTLVVDVIYHVLKPIICLRHLLTWLIHRCDMPHSYVRHDSFVCATWLIHVCDISMRVIWLIFRRDSYISLLVPATCRHDCDWCMDLTQLIWTCNTTHSDMQHDSNTCVNWLIHVNDMTHARVWHDSRTCVMCTSAHK